MEIHIKTIPDSMMRLPGGVGDYWYDHEGVLQVRVVEMEKEIYCKMVIIHELIEEALTKERGLGEPDIQAFDDYYEQRRKMGLVPEDSEPGFDASAPYVREHTASTAIEMLMCAMAGISWTDYDRYVMNL